MSDHHAGARTPPEALVVGMKTPIGHHKRCGQLKEACHWEVGFQVSEVQARPSVTLLPAKLDVELSAPCPAPCLPVMHASHYDDNGVNL